VALEALKGVKTVQQIAKEFDVHPVQVSEWNKRLSTQAEIIKATLFIIA
jgi:transposase